MSKFRIEEKRIGGKTHYSVAGDPDRYSYLSRPEAEQRAKALDNPVRMTPWRRR